MLEALLFLGQIMLLFLNYATFLIMLFEKIAKKSKKYSFWLASVGLRERNATNTTTKFK